MAQTKKPNIGKAYEKFYEEGRLEGYKIGVTEELARVKALKIAIVTGTVIVGGLGFLFARVRFRAAMQSANAEVKRIRRAISMKEHEIAMTRAQKSVLQTSHSQQLLSFSQQTNSTQSSMQKLAAGNYLLLETIHRARKNARPRKAMMHEYKAKTQAVRAKVAECRRENVEMRAALERLRAIALMYGAIIAMFIAYFP